MPPTYRSKSISQKYSLRYTQVGPMQKKILQEMKVVMLKGLREATQRELYDRTTLPVTEEMLRSCNAIIRGDQVIVGYGVGKRVDKAKHAIYRVNMKGRSKLGGHNLQMQPEKYTYRKYRGELIAIHTKYHKEMLGA